MHFCRSILLAALSLAVPCSAQVFAQAKESILIGPGDIVNVQVFETDELRQTTRVGDDGQLQLKMGGDVKLAGKSLEEAAHLIEARLRERDYLKEPHVLVSVQEFATQKVSVFGEVHTPGVFSITTVRSITSVLAMAGGFNDLADRHVFVERSGTHERIPYFVSNSPQDQKVNMIVEPGDTVIVPKAKIVYVLGDVRSPGGYAMTTNQSNLSVLQLIARAGGTNYSAVPSHTRLMHKTEDGGYTQENLNLSAMQKGKRPDQYLQGDDIVYVPFSYVRNLISSGSSGIPSSVASAALYRF
jgi:polysaccharide biosynthesis/export protein